MNDEININKISTFENTEERPLKQNESVLAPSVDGVGFPKTVSDKFFFLDISFWILLITSIFLPIFFIPTKPILLSFNKISLLYTGVFLSSIFLLLHFIKGGKFIMPKRYLSVTSFLTILVLTLSSINSGNFRFSFSGHGFEMGSLSFIILFFTIFFLSAIIFQERKKINRAQLIIFVPFVILSVYYLLKVFIGGKLFDLESVFGIFADTFLGGWNELSMFAGAVVIFSGILLMTLKNTRPTKLLYHLSFLLSLLVLVVVNFHLSWVLASVVFLVFFFLNLFCRAPGKALSESESNISVRRKIRGFHIFVIFFIVASIFILPSGKIIKEKIYSFLDISHIEVKPSWQGTAKIFSATMKESIPSLFLGSGPNSFSYQWRLYKPIGVNTTSFWNNNFDYGAGLIPTFSVTSGLLSLLLWSIFILGYLILGFKHVYRNYYRGLSTAFFAVSFYFWLVSIFYLPSHVIFTFTALFSGIFLASMLNRNLQEQPEVVSSGFSLRNFFVFLFIVIITLNSFSGYVIYKKFIGALNFEKGVSAFNGGDLDSAEEKIVKSINFSEDDSYKKLLSEVYLNRLRQFSTNIRDPNQEEIADFKRYFEATLQSIEEAIVLNPRSFENLIELGRIYKFLAGLGVANSYENSKNAYISAEQLDPQNPLPDFLISDLELSSNHLKEAEQYVLSALSKKQNYGDALFLHSKIKFLQGNLEEALNTAIYISKVFPKEPYAYFHLGLLYFEAGDYTNATNAFKIATDLLPSFANARYFLGLSLFQDEKTEEAILEIQKLQEDFPENNEIIGLLDLLNQSIKSQNDSALILEEAGIEDTEENELPFND